MGRTYTNYLRSEHWKAKRLAILKRDNFQCQLCDSNDNLHVHHRYYSNGSQKNILGNEPDYLLLTLCGDCHSLWHEVYGRIKLRKAKVVKIRRNLFRGMDKREAFTMIYKNNTPTRG